MGICNDAAADAEVIYLCTNSVNTTPPPPMAATAIQKVKENEQANKREMANS